MSSSQSYLALDVGEKRIGVAVASGSVKIAVPYDTIDVDGSEVERIAELIVSERTDVVVVGYPRNQSGEATAQTTYVEEFAEKLKDIAPKVEFQDESLTSVLAEQQLGANGAAYSKADVDMTAAAIILQDYLDK